MQKYLKNRFSKNNEITSYGILLSFKSGPDILCNRGAESRTLNSRIMTKFSSITITLSNENHSRDLAIFFRIRKNKIFGTSFENMAWKHPQKESKIFYATQIPWMKHEWFLAVYAGLLITSSISKNLSVPKTCEQIQ